jgi:chromosome segregation ATPase
MEMGWKNNLFDDDAAKEESADRSPHASDTKTREVPTLDRLKNLEEKISVAVDRVKALKEEKIILERRIRELEALLNEKNQEIESLGSEKKSIGSQIETLLNELETIEL